MTDRRFKTAEDLLADDQAAISEMVRHGGFAYPTDVSMPSGGVAMSPGMTLLDYFAGQYIQHMAQVGLTCNPSHLQNYSTPVPLFGLMSPEEIAKKAYEVARAMIKERESTS